jgi:hypothetical protein
MMNTGQVNKKEPHALLNMQMGPMLKYLNMLFFVNKNKFHLLTNCIYYFSL